VATLSIANVVLPVDRKNLNHFVNKTEHVKPVDFLRAKESEPQGEPIDQQVEEDGVSECYPVTG
jgi:hypothetical protein